MNYGSAWKHGSERAGDPDTGESRAQHSDESLNDALDALRRLPMATPSWNETETLIYSSGKERKMPYVSKAGLFAYTRKWMLVAGASMVMLLAFFAVPFSQTQPVGANITFSFDQAPADCEHFDFSRVLDEPFWGVNNCNVKIKMEEAGSMHLELLVMTENGLVPSDLVAALTEEYPELADARVTVDPITETSTGTMFDHLTGELDVQIDCEGKTAEEIQAEILQRLADQGVDDAQVTVESEGDDKMMIKVEVRDEVEEGEEE